MKVFELKLSRDLEDILSNFTTPEIREKTIIIIKENRELFTLLKDLVEESQKKIYVKIVGFFEEKVIYTLDKENIIEAVVNSFLDLIDSFLDCNKKVLNFFDQYREDSYIFSSNINTVKICIDL